MHHVTLVAFPLASHHPAPSSLHLVNILLVNSTYVLKLDYGGSCKSCPFHIVDADGPTILGLPTSKDLNLVTMNFSITNNKGASRPSTTPRPICDPDPAAEEWVLKKFKYCFEGCFQGEYRITVDPAVPPVVHPPRRVPEALRKPLKKELVSLVEQGILAKFTEPIDWVNFLVCVMDLGP